MNDGNPVDSLIGYWNIRYSQCVTSPFPHFIHSDDQPLFLANPKLCAAVPQPPIESETIAPGFHLSLQPVPYMGDIRRADIFLLMTNPVVRREDYCDNENQKFTEALRENIGGVRKTCLAWDTEGVGETSWTRYYRNEVLGPTVRDYPEMSERLKTRLAILELVPYYSSNARCITDKLLAALPSVQVAKRAAKYLEERANKGEAHLIVRWRNGCKRWGVCEDGDNIVHSPARRGLSQCAKVRLLEWLEHE